MRTNQSLNDNYCYLTANEFITSHLGLNLYTDIDYILPVLDYRVDLAKISACLSTTVQLSAFCWASLLAITVL